MKCPLQSGLARFGNGKREGDVGATVVKVDFSSVKESEFGAIKKGSNGKVTQSYKYMSLIKGVNLVHLVYLQM